MHDDYGIVASVAELVARRGDAARLDATPRGRVRTLHAGAYASAHQGRGMEFDETRQYQPGDDVRAIDWRVSSNSMPRPRNADAYAPACSVRTRPRGVASSRAASPRRATSSATLATMP